MVDVLKTIAAHRTARGWSEYQLADKSGLPQSTISSWYRKGMMPTIPSLEKICTAFGITLSQLFAENEMIELTPELKVLFEDWTDLTLEQKQAVQLMLKTMKHR